MRKVVLHKNISQLDFVHYSLEKDMYKKTSDLWISKRAKTFREKQNQESYPSYVPVFLFLVVSMSIFFLSHIFMDTTSFYYSQKDLILSPLPKNALQPILVSPSLNLLQYFI